jgi:hypothetical protein
MPFGSRAKNSSKGSNISKKCGLINALQLFPNFYPEGFSHLIPAKIPTISPVDNRIPFKHVGETTLSVDMDDHCVGRTLSLHYYYLAFVLLTYY